MKYKILIIIIIINLWFWIANVSEASELYTVTAYCSCEKCCGEWSDGITYTGSRVVWGTVAVDRKQIPLGSMVTIEGFDDTIFKAEDIGGAIKGNHIDVWYPSHQEALNHGVQKRKVIVYK